MQVQSTPPPPQQPKKERISHITGGEALELALRFTNENKDQIVDAFRSVGVGIRDAWGDLTDYIDKVFELPEVEDFVSPEDRRKITDVAIKVARGVGYTAAGVQGVAGAYKLVKGYQKGDTGTMIDGSVGLATSAAIATTVAGLVTAPLILGPLAATLGVTRGIYNGVAGYRQGDSRKEIQGILDATRSAAVFGRLLATRSAALGTAASILGPVAGALQIGRGYYDLTTGLEKESKAKQVQGLADMTSALGLTLATTGVGTIPGIALAVSALAVKGLYDLSDRFEAKVNRGLDRINPQLRGTTRRIDAVVDPAMDKVRPWLEKVLGEKGREGPDDQP